MKKEKLARTLMVLVSFSLFISQIWKYLLLHAVWPCSRETIGEGEAYDSAKVHVRFLSINKRIECFFEVFVEPLGWVICYLMLA